MEHVTSSCLIFFALVTFFIAMPFATGFSLTKGNSYLANYVIKTLFVKDWISCTIACQVEEMCVSYNYNTITRACDLNVGGIHEPLTGADELVKMHGVVFHQIKPAERMFPPRKVQSLNQCDCSCTLESACRPGQDSYDSLPISCKEIWEKTNIRVDGTFYIRTGLPSRYEEVFCHMTPINGCGDGGWTLVMKIDGQKENCTQQGFNSGNEYARARIGIVGDDSGCVAENLFKSRIGFGASGNWYGMKNDNSCGNEYARNVSIVAFGYIFVQ